MNSRGCIRYPANKPIRSHAVAFENLPAGPAKLSAMLLEALLDGAVAIAQLLPAQPRRVARTGAALLRSA